MAIIDSLPGLEVTIQSFAQDLPEYEDDGEWSLKRFPLIQEEARTSKYVECRADAEFKVKVQLTRSYPPWADYDLTFKIYVDDQRIASDTCSARRFSSARSYQAYVDTHTQRISATQRIRRSLKFSTIKKVDDPDSTRVKNDAKLASGVGEIIVSVLKTKTIEIEPYSREIIAAQHEPLTEISEKALKGKALSVGLSYGPQLIEYKPAAQVTNRMVDLDGPNKPIAVFVFKYRSREDLQSELIVPRSPSPETEEMIPADARSENNGTLSREARLEKLKREIEDIKAEDEDQYSTGGKRRRTSEVQRGKASKAIFVEDGNTLIDLTDD